MPIAVLLISYKISVIFLWIYLIYNILIRKGLLRMY